MLVTQYGTTAAAESEKFRNFTMLKEWSSYRLATL